MKSNQKRIDLILLVGCISASILLFMVNQSQARTALVPVAKGTRIERMDTAELFRKALQKPGKQLTNSSAVNQAAQFLVSQIKGVNLFDVRQTLVSKPIDIGGRRVDVANSTMAYGYLIEMLKQAPPSAERDVLLNQAATAVEFLILANRLSKNGPDVLDPNLPAFFRQLEIAAGELMKFESGDRENHIKVMNRAVEIAKSNSSQSSPVHSLVRAIQELYPKNSKEILERLKTCKII